MRERWWQRVRRYELIKATTEFRGRYRQGGWQKIEVMAFLTTLR